MLYLGQATEESNVFRPIRSDGGHTEIRERKKHKDLVNGHLENCRLILSTTKLFCYSIFCDTQNREEGKCRKKMSCNCGEQSCIGYVLWGRKNSARHRTTPILVAVNHTDPPSKEPTRQICHEKSSPNVRCKATPFRPSIQLGVESCKLSESMHKPNVMQPPPLLPLPIPRIPN